MLTGQLGARILDGALAAVIATVGLLELWLPLPSVIGAIGVTIRAVLALAPTNFRFWVGMPTIAPKGYAFATILPAADGDVVDNNGAQFYDQSVPEPYASQVYVHSANHNFFNTEWRFDGN